MFKPRFRLFIPLLVLASAVAPAPQLKSAPAITTDDSIPVSDDYVLRTWEVDDGLPSNSVSGIAQTPDGYLWLTTGSGLARFDGVRFTLFPKETTPGLESNRMAPVFTDRAGTLWIGLERGGVARKVGRRFEMIAQPAPSGAAPTWTSSFAQDAAGEVWFGLSSDRRVFRWHDGVLTAFSGREGVGPGGNTTVSADSSGRIWVTTTAGGCAVFDGARFQPVDNQGGIWPVLAPARDGGMWAFRGQHLLHYRAGGSGEAVSPLVDLQASVLYEDSAGDLWMGTKNQGLFRFRDGQFIRVPTSHSSVSSIMEDREGNLWVGTFGGGLNRLRPRRFFLRQNQNGLPVGSILSLCEDAEGKLWLAGVDRLLVRAVDSGNRSFAAPEGWSGASVMALCSDPAGDVWMGTLSGLIRWRNGLFSQESLQDALTGLFVDRQGDLWAATIKDGLIRWRNGLAERIPEQGGLVEPRALAEDAAGRLWVGTEAGLVFQHQGERFVPVPLPGEEAGSQIRFIVPDEGDTVWIGEFGGGLYRWRAGRVAALPHDAGLPVDDLRSLVIGPDGDLWFGTGRGLFRVARDEIDAAIEGRRETMRTVAYRRNDGMPNTDFMFGFKSTVTRTRDGHLWFATSRGALEIVPHDSLQTVRPLPLVIEEIQVGNTVMPVAGTGKLMLPPQPGTLQIRYTLPALSAPEQVHFRYRLIGWGDEWIAADRQRSATFTHLPPGNYRFEVAAAEADGPWLPATASLAFAVRAAWWETAWFHLGLGLFGALALAALVKFVVKRRMREKMLRLEQEHALERERTRIARDMHDEMGASLTRIALMSELAAGEPDVPASAGGRLGAIATAARAVVATLDEIVWMVNPRNDTLERLVGYLAESAGEFMAATETRLTLDLPEMVPAYVVPSAVRHHLVLVVREALNNVVKHAGARTVRVRIALGNETLTVVIADDGRGFASDAVAPSSNGLFNSRHRLVSVGGSYRIESRPGAGTTVTLTLPLPRLPSSVA